MWVWGSHRGKKNFFAFLDDSDKVQKFILKVENSAQIGSPSLPLLGNFTLFLLYPFLKVPLKKLLLILSSDYSIE